MINAKEILNKLKELYNSGATYTELGDKLGVSKSYIHSLLSGDRAVDGLTVRKINQLFPNAVLHIDGDKAENNVIEINIDRLLNSTEFTAEEKIKILRVIKK